jgi:hypothetical protein
VKSNLHLNRETEGNLQSMSHSLATVLSIYDLIVPNPVGERSKARVCCRSLAGVAGSNSTAGMNVCVVCCREISDMMTKDIKVHNG